MSETYTGRTSVILGVPRERADGERRVALIPDIVRRLVDDGATVIVESGAGEGSSHPDAAYEEAGATVVQDPSEVYASADVVLKVQAPATYDDIDELGALRSGQRLVAFLSPLVRHDLINTLRDKGVEAFSLDAIPRTTRAQSMDALSSQSNLAGYKAVIMAADQLGKIFPLMMTAAGTITPARVLILGAGVAGLQAIGTAKRLGAVVYGYDVRAVVKEQVESLGAKFVELDLGEDLSGSGGYARQASEEQTRRQQAELAKEIALADVVITTALIPGRPAPLLITAEAVRGMKPGSVIVDLAGEMGGNCELSQPGQTVVEHNVTIMAPTNIPSLIPVHASQVLSKNIQSFIGLIIRDGALDVNFDDDIVAGTAIVHNGEIVHELTRKVMGLPEPGAAEPAPAEPQESPAVEPVTLEQVAGDAQSELEGVALDEAEQIDDAGVEEVTVDGGTVDDGITTPDEVFDDIDGEIGNDVDRASRRDSGDQA
ncbi:MAG TPA: Re/Si-specific NAD(P)(+) transhydrogenase subunit alpha [Thermomicrobiales bacterium]|nr:Re/Si-specific NAD(P)(+) transhydrogenase subunit alpha [Thermomicrobiales bacterium]